MPHFSAEAEDITSDIQKGSGNCSTASQHYKMEDSTTIRKI